MLRSSGFLDERRTLHDVEVNITSYRIGDTFHCHVSNVDPGATIARSEGKTREEAIDIALAKAAARL